MAIVPSSDPAQYRVTFFFGPEAVEERPDHLRCVFNVKKRSWKGGVQVAVDVARRHLDRARERIGYASWLAELIHSGHQEEREELTSRADDLFVQSLCTSALNLALQAGIEQVNQQIDAATFADELHQLLDEQPEQVTDRIRLELDLGTVVPSIAGPKRPQDRIILAEAKSQFALDVKNYGVEGNLREEEVAAGGGEHAHGSYILKDGAVVIASITSCTNTSNPSVMIGAALVAKKAVEKGLTRKPWVKTSLAPGSKVVTDYLDRAELTDELNALGFNLVGYGCTTCIGNSGPLPDEISAAVNEHDLTVCSVLSGNRNFEGRINPDVKMNYLASPPLVVAYAIAGTMDVDLVNDAIGQDASGADVFLRDIWPSEHDIAQTVEQAVQSDMFRKSYAQVYDGDVNWSGLEVPEGDRYVWDAASTYVRNPPYFEDMPREPEPVRDILGARVLAKLGDSVTTDHISPAGAIKKDSPAGHYLMNFGVGASGDAPAHEADVAGSDNGVGGPESLMRDVHGVEPKDFNSYGSRRGNHEVMIRGTFANIRLRNQLAPGTEGGFTRDFTNNIAEAEEAVAQTVGNLRLLEDDAREAREASAEWLSKARAASDRVHYSDVDKLYVRDKGRVLRTSRDGSPLP